MRPLGSLLAAAVLLAVLLVACGPSSAAALSV